MQKHFFILAGILISLQTFARIGQNTDYWLISESDYIMRNLNGKDVTLRRHIVVPFMDKNFKTIFETNDQEALLAKFAFMLKKNKTRWMEKYLANCDTTLHINNLIKGLYYFSQKNYSQSLFYLNRFEDKRYNFLKQLLIADCFFELLADKKDYRLIINYYQSALDMTASETYKELIHNRIKYIKYL
jgi:hypothetical protein